METHAIPTEAIVLSSDAAPRGRSHEPYFASRLDAGQKLKSVLYGRTHAAPTVVGVTSGGVIVAAVVAEALDAPLDVVAVERIEHPSRPGLAIGAVTKKDAVYLPTSEGLAIAELTHATTRAQQEVAQYERRLRSQIEQRDLAGRQVIVVDDGIVTGATMTAALRAINARGAAEVLVAAPIASVDGMARVLREATETLCLHVLRDLGRLSDWYRTFPPADESTIVFFAQAAASAFTQNANAGSGHSTERTLR